MKRSICKMKLVFWCLFSAVVVIIMGMLCVQRLDYSAKGLVLNIIGALITALVAFPQPNYESVGGIVVEDGTPMGNGMTAGEMRDLCERNCAWSKRSSVLGIFCLILGFAFQLYYQLATR